MVRLDTAQCSCVTRLVWLNVAVAFAMFAGCAPGASPPSDDTTSGRATYAITLMDPTPSSLPTCTSSLDGQVAYVSSPPGIWVCHVIGMHAAWRSIACNTANDGSVAYASTSQVLVACINQAWTLVPLRAGPPGPPGDAGPPGPQGEAGLNEQVTTTVLPMGDMHCPNGGFEVQFWLDLTGNGIMDPGDVQSTAFVCNGLDADAGPAPSSCDRSNWMTLAPDVAGCDLANTAVMGDLSGYDFTGADLAGARMSTANLTNANLTGANLAGAAMDGVNLTGATLTGVNLAETNLTGATLNGIVVGGGLTGNPIGLPSGWNVLDGYFVGPGVNLTGANLTDAYLAFVDMSNSNLTHATLRNANLTNVNLIAATLTSANLTHATLTSASVSAAHLDGATLPFANLSGADGEGATLINANLAVANMSDSNWVDANMTGADLSSANLTDSALMSANLTNANLAQAVLWNANLSGANLTGANLILVAWHNTTCPDGTNSDAHGGVCTP